MVIVRLLFLSCLPLSAQWGTFLNTVRVEFDPDGRKVSLLTDFIYQDPEGRRWITPAGAPVDGASIPQSLWSVVGGPYEGKYREASVIHDFECDRRVSPWQEVHRRFYMGMRARGVEPVRAKFMFWAVFSFGPKWDLAGVLGPRSEPQRADLESALRHIERRERGEILQAVEVADPAIRRKLDAEREELKSALAASLSAEASLQTMQRAYSMFENQSDAPALKEMTGRAERRNASAVLAVTRAKEKLRLLEAEARQAAGPPRPMPPIELPELEKLTVEKLRQ